MADVFADPLVFTQTNVSSPDGSKASVITVACARLVNVKSDGKKLETRGVIIENGVETVT